MKSIEAVLAERIQKELNPVHFEIYNESENHHRPPGAESHFKLIVVSSKFQGLSRVDRQRLVNALAADQMKLGLHALAQWTYTPEEWQTMQNQKADREIPRHESPECTHHNKPKKPSVGH